MTVLPFGFIKTEILAESWNEMGPSYKIGLSIKYRTFPASSFDWSLSLSKWSFLSEIMKN
jgi:hypothetical protein